jgi:hypothetical protein
MSRNLADVAEGWKWDKPPPEVCDGQDWSGVARHPSTASAIRATPYLWRDPATIPTRDWIYGHQLLRGSVSLVVAPGATGKTAMMVGTSLALATGRTLLSKKVWGGPKAVWLWNLEDSSDELARGIQAAAMHWNIAADDLMSGNGTPLLYVDSGLDGAELKTAHSGPSGCAINAPVISALVDELQSRSVDVLIVDPFVSSHAVEENDNNAIDLVAKQWAKVAKITGTSIVLVHHARKLGGTEVGAESARGASALVAAARSVMTHNRMSDEEASRFGIEAGESRRYFRTYDDKNNRAPPSDKSDWFRLHSVSLGNGPDGGDSLPVVVPWCPPDAFEGVDVAALRAVQERLSEGTYRQDHQATMWAGKAVADVLGLNADKPSDRARIKTMLATWLANGALAVAMKLDERRKEKPFLVVGQWVEGDAPPVKRGVEQGGAVAH